MGRPVVVGGSPGCGKTTLCAELAELDENGVHLHTDDFFGYLAHRIDPSKPNSRAQNETVVGAYCSAAAVFVEGGYSVYVDGVIGPWLHAEILSSLGSFDYILLHASLPETLSRIADRNHQASARPSVAERMHHQFEEVLEEYSAHVIHSDRHTVSELVDAVRARLQSGKCTIGDA